MRPSMTPIPICFVDSIESSQPHDKTQVEVVLNSPRAAAYSIQVSNESSVETVVLVPKPCEQGGAGRDNKARNNAFLRTHRAVSTGAPTAAARGRESQSCPPSPGRNYSNHFDTAPITGSGTVKDNSTINNSLNNMTFSTKRDASCPPALSNDRGRSPRVNNDDTPRKRKVSHRRPYDDARPTRSNNKPNLVNQTSRRVTLGIFLGSGYNTRNQLIPEVM